MSADNFGIADECLWEDILDRRGQPVHLYRIVERTFSDGDLSHDFAMYFNSEAEWLGAIHDGIWEYGIQVTRPNYCPHCSKRIN